MAEDDQTVQSDEGQGGQVDTFGYDLSGVPEDHRDIVAEHVNSARQRWDSEAGKKFQEHSEYRKQWEPYEQLGVNNLPTEDVQALLDFGRLTQDEQAFNEWLANVARERGIVPPEEQGGQDFDQEAINRLLDERLGPVQQHIEAQETQARLQTANDEIQSTLSELQTKHGDFDTEIVCGLALQYQDTDAQTALSKAYEQYAALVSDAEKRVLESKANQPETPERGGSPAAGAEKVTGWGDASAMARERLRQAR